MAVVSFVHSFPLYTSPRPRNLKHTGTNVNSNLRLFSSRIRANSEATTAGGTKSEYQMGFLDDLLLGVFRNKMVQEVGWDSEKPGYDGLMEVVSRMMRKGRSNIAIQQSAVRILVSLFPQNILYLFRMLIAPLGGGKLASIMTARVTVLTCQWLMGTCKINSIELPDGSSRRSGVLVEKCKYLEESKCVGTCIHTCKLPTQTFINDYLGVPLVMEPNFTDFSCQFKFGVPPSQPEEDKMLQEPCLDICPKAALRRKPSRPVTGPVVCPKV